MALLQRRVHVGPYEFGNGAATDYWINFDGEANQVAAASATNPYGLSGWGFTTTSLVATQGASGDLNSSTDFTPTHILTNAATDAFVTPRIFGGYDQFQRVSDVLGYMPTILRLDAYAAFTAGANEATTFFGFVAPTVTDCTAAGSGAAIREGAITFALASDTNSDNGTTTDTAWHRWRIEVGSSTTEWFDDIATPGTLASNGTIATQPDIYPLSFKMIAGTTGRIGLSWIRISYR